MKKFQFHMIKKLQLNILLFLLPLFLLAVLNLITPHKPAISSLENRMLKTKPVFTVEKLFSGGYFKEYEKYFADNFIFREKFVSISGNIKNMWSLPGNDNVTIVVNKGANVAETHGNDPQNKYANTGESTENNSIVKQNPELSANPNNNQNTNNDAASPSENDEKSGKVFGRILVLNDKAMEIHTFNAEASRYYAHFINKFQEKLANNRIKVYSLLAPTQIEFITQEKYKNMSSSQRKTIAYVNTYFNENIIPVNTYAPLQDNADKYLYFRSDHHWTALGAYYAYTAFIKSSGEKPVPLERYQTAKVAPYLGSLYSATLNNKIKENPDIVYLYKPFLKYEYTVYYEVPVKMDILNMRFAQQQNKYGIFLGGDSPWAKITTEIKNGKKIAVIKDSYANAFIPFLLPHYEEIYIIDPREFNLDIFNFIKERNIQEVLFLNYVLITDNTGFTDLLIKMSHL